MTTHRVAEVRFTSHAVSCTCGELVSVPDDDFAVPVNERLAAAFLEHRRRNGVSNQGNGPVYGGGVPFNIRFSPKAPRRPKEADR